MQKLNNREVEELTKILNQADLFVSETVLQKVYARNDVTLVDFVQPILRLSHLPSREKQITEAFEQFIANYTHLNARQYYDGLS